MSEVESARAALAEAAQRVTAFLDEREQSAGLDPEDITAFNYAVLRVSDLRALAAAATTPGQESGPDVAWDEGYNAGFQNGAEAAGRESVTRHPNPYSWTHTGSGPCTETVGCLGCTRAAEVAPGQDEAVSDRG